MTTHAHRWSYFYVPGDAYRYCACGARETVDPDGKTGPVPEGSRRFVENKIMKLEKRAAYAVRKKTFGGLTFAIDRPKGTVKEWKQPDGSVKRFTYPVDYGYLPGHKAEDGEGLDFFVGDDEDGHYESFQKLKDGVLDESKFLAGVTTEEREAIYSLYGPEIWHRRTYRNMDELKVRLPHYRATTQPRYTLQLGQFGEMEKDAGILDALKGFFGRGHQPTAMPLTHTRPHAQYALPKTAPWAEHSPTIVPPAPKTQSGGTGEFLTTTLPVQARASHPAPAPAFGTHASHAPAPPPVTPVRSMTYGEMVMNAPGMRETLKTDMRARLALGALPVSGGGFVATRVPDANALGQHLMHHAPGQHISSEMLHRAMSSPEYMQARAQYKGASLQTQGKLAMLHALGFKYGGTKFADIAKHLMGEVMLESPGGARGAFERLREQGLL